MIIGKLLKYDNVHVAKEENVEHVQLANKAYFHLSYMY